MLLIASTGAAQDNSAFAQQRFSRGVELYDARQYEQALAEFRASLELFPSPNARLYVARSLREMGRLAEAVMEYERTVREANDRAQIDPRYTATRDSASTELTALEPRVGRLTVRATDIPAGARVTVGGREIPVAGLGVPIPATPGQVAVVVELDGREVARREAEVAAGGTASVDLQVDATALAATTQGQAGAGANAGGAGSGEIVTPPPPVVPEPPPAPSPDRTLAWVGFGVGAAGLVSFGVFALLANSQYQELSSQCNETTCPSDRIEDIDRGRTYQTITNVSLGVGLVGLAAGALLYVAAPTPRVTEQARAPRRGLQFGVSANSINLLGVF